MTKVAATQNQSILMGKIMEVLKHGRHHGGVVSGRSLSVGGVVSGRSLSGGGVVSDFDILLKEVTNSVVILGLPHLTDSFV
jgi:hypothetical protein